MQPLIIVGESATGKTTVAEMLVNRIGGNKLITHTTRGKRKGEPDNAYIWSNKEDGFPPDNFLPTTFKGNLYYTTVEEFESSTVAIVTEDAMDEIIAKYPDTLAIRLYYNNRALKQERLFKRQPDVCSERLGRFLRDFTVANDRVYTLELCIDNLTVDVVYNIVSQLYMLNLKVR